MPDLIVFPRKGRPAGADGDALRNCLHLLENIELIHRNLRVIIASCADGPGKNFLLAQQGLLEASLRDIRNGALAIGNGAASWPRKH